MTTKFSRAARPLSLSLLALALAACGSSHEGDSNGAGLARLAVQMQDHGDSLGARDFYARALERDPKNIVALKGLAAIAEKSGDLDGAADLYRRALEEASDDSDLHRGLGRVLLGQKKPKDAKKQFEKALSANDDNLAARAGVAVCDDYMGDHDKAQKIYRQILEKEPTRLGVLNNLAYSLIMAGRPAEAIPLLEPLLGDPRATAALRQNLALAYGLVGREAEAERLGRHDLPRTDVKANLDFYRARRGAAVPAVPAPEAAFAFLGRFPTEAMAAGARDKASAFLKEGLSFVIAPELSGAGGTPSFLLSVTGPKAEGVKAFCDALDQAAANDTSLTRCALPHAEKKS